MLCEGIAMIIHWLCDILHHAVLVALPGFISSYMHGVIVGVGTWANVGIVTWSHDWTEFKLHLFADIAPLNVSTYVEDISSSVT